MYCVIYIVTAFKRQVYTDMLFMFLFLVMVKANEQKRNKINKDSKSEMKCNQFQKCIAFNSRTNILHCFFGVI